GDVWTSRPAEGFELSPSVRLIHTPGHTPQDITTLIGTPDGILAATHLWWHVGGPTEDPSATDPVALHEGRQRVAALADIIVPGHAKPSSLDAAGPRGTRRRGAQSRRSARRAAPGRAAHCDDSTG